MFISEHYFIFTYNIGLIIAMIYALRVAFKANGHSESEVIGIVVAAIIWPIMIATNVLAVLFSNMRNIVNMLIIKPKVPEQETEHDSTTKLEAK